MEKIIEKRDMIRRIHERRFYGRCPYCLTEMISHATMADIHIPNLFIKPNDPIIICQKCFRVFPVVETTEATIFDSVVTKYINGTNCVPKYIMPVFIPDYIESEIDHLNIFDHSPISFISYPDNLYSIHAIIHKYIKNNSKCEDIVAFIIYYNDGYQCLSIKNNESNLSKEFIEKIRSRFHIIDDCVDFLTSVEYANIGGSLINFNDNINSWLIDDGSYLYFKKII